VLELAIAHELYASYPDFSEGRLAKIRSHVVSRASCAVVARELDLGAHLLGQGGEDERAGRFDVHCCQALRCFPARAVKGISPPTCR